MTTLSIKLPSSGRAVPEHSPWFASGKWPAEVPKQPTFPELSLPELLDAAVRDHPARLAIWQDGTIVTYARLGQLVDRLAAALYRLGVRKREVVALYLPNCIQYTVSYFACLKIGAIVTGINPTFKPAEVLNQLEEVNARVLICLDANYEENIAPIRDRHALAHVISTNITDCQEISRVKRFFWKLLGRIPSGKVPGALQFRDLVESDDPDSKVAVPRVKINPREDPAVYTLTAGTTGVPKAAVLTHHNCVVNALQCKHWFFQHQPGTGVLGVLPLFHSFGMTVVQNTGVALGGYSILFARPPSMRDLARTIDELGSEHPLIVPGVELLFMQLAQYLKLNPLPGLHQKILFAICGAGPLHRYVKEMFEDAVNPPGCETPVHVIEGYGLSEASPVVSAGPLTGNADAGTLGLPLPGTAWTIFPANEFDQGPLAGYGEEFTGEICVHGPQVMQGYLNRPEATRETLREFEGQTWLRTGDLGYMDEIGQVILRDRKKFMVRTRGYSVFPREVEELIGRHPRVKDVAVAGVPHPEFGEYIKAWVVLQPGDATPPTSDDLLAWCRENLSHFKVPREIEVREEIPKSLVGKILRGDLEPGLTPSDSNGTGVPSGGRLA